jgi:hypothetical protein
MFDLSRLTRLITLALASCAVTWALAGSALAVPDKSLVTAAGTPTVDTAPGDVNKTPDPAQVQKVLNGISRGKTGPVRPAVDTNDDTGTIALIVAIAAMLTALGAVTLIVTRPQRPVLRA